MSGPTVTRVVTAPDEYQVWVTWHALDVDRCSPEVALLVAENLVRRNPDNPLLIGQAHELRAAAEPPDLCRNGDGNYVEWGNGLCGPCCEDADETAHQLDRTRKGY